MLRFWVRIPPMACMFVCCECCVLSIRGLCDGLITRPEESYRLWRVIVYDLETSWMRRPWTSGGSRAKNKQLTVAFCLSNKSFWLSSPWDDLLYHVGIRVYNVEEIGFQQFRRLSFVLRGPSGRINEAVCVVAGIEASERKPHLASCLVLIYISLIKKTEENTKRVEYDSLETVPGALSLRVK